MATDSPLAGPGPDRVMLAGDWHGNAGRATSLIMSAGARGIPVVLQLGDFGFWTPGPWTDRYLDAIEETCARHGVTLLWCDGNHECFAALYALPVDPGTGLRTIRPHIFHLPRGLRWDWHGKVWMALGGAVSVDRHMRTEGKSWWPEETLSDQDVARAIDGGPVDVIVAHDTASGYEIPGLAPDGFFPQHLIYESEIHRRRVGEIVDATKPTVLYHGHYHVSYTAYRGDTRIVGLAADDSSFVKNAMVLDLTS